MRVFPPLFCSEAHLQLWLSLSHPLCLLWSCPCWVAWPREPRTTTSCLCVPPALGAEVAPSTWESLGCLTFVRPFTSSVSFVADSEMFLAAKLPGVGSVFLGESTWARSWSFEFRSLSKIQSPCSFQVIF